MPSGPLMPKFIASLVPYQHTHTHTHTETHRHTHTDIQVITVHDIQSMFTVLDISHEEGNTGEHVGGVWRAPRPPALRSQRGPERWPRCLYRSAASGRAPSPSASSYLCRPCTSGKSSLHAPSPGSPSRCAPEHRAEVRGQRESLAFCIAGKARQRGECGHDGMINCIRVCLVSGRWGCSQNEITLHSHWWISEVQHRWSILLTQNAVHYKISVTRHRIILGEGDFKNVL